jgi:glycosyltransferase involved in cell wall biosynthesis
MEEKIDLLILTCYDWVTTGFKYAKGIMQYKKDLKIVCQSIFKTPLFNYEETMPYFFLKDSIPKSEKNHIKILKSSTPYYHIYVKKTSSIYQKLHNLISNSKVIYLHAETYIELEDFDYKNKPIIAGVSGHPYRRKPKEFIDFFNPFIKQGLVQCPDLLNYGLINEELVYYGVDTDKILPYSFNLKNEKLKIGHFSSNPQTKGSDVIINAILEIIEKYPDKIEYVGYKLKDLEKNKIDHKINWEDNIKRMAECDIYIETCKPFLNPYGAHFIEYNNTRFGEWGNTCLEAAASGCIVISNSLSYKYYKKNYTKKFPLLIANDKDAIKEHLVNLIKMTPQEILSLKNHFRRWVIDNHSLIQTGKRFYEKILKKFYNNRYK